MLPYLNSKPNNNKINIPLIKRALFEILEQNGINNVSKAYLFGSYARGEETYESDIDIRLEVKDSFSLIDLSFISSELKEKLNKDIDVISSGGLDEHFLNRINSFYRSKRRRFFFIIGESMCYNAIKREKRAARLFL